MPSFNAFILASSLVFGFSSYAAIDCKPGMGNCPETGYQGDPAKPPPTLPSPSPYLAIGYAEVSSPDCHPDDLVTAREMARSKAKKMAQDAFNSVFLVELPGSFWSEACKKGIYSNSAPGLSWVVQYFARFEK